MRQKVIQAISRLRPLVRPVVFVFVVFCGFLVLIKPRSQFKEPTSFVLEDAQGNLLNAAIAADGQWRFPHGDAVPQKFLDCITVFEDKRFYRHAGIDVAAIARALSANVRYRAKKQGGSTITMQVARLAAHNRQRNIFNKLREAWRVIGLEIYYSKNEIMSLYAANAPFGSNVVGLEAASWRYYGREPATLGWAEMATLAILPNAPSLIYPGKNREALLLKRNTLLQKLVATGKISREESALAMLEPLPGKPLSLPQEAPHLLDRFRQEKIAKETTRLRTTIDGPLQRAITGIVKRQHEFLKGNGINNICALVLDVEHGNALAYVGNISPNKNKDFEADVDVINSPRSPGSTLKPLLYAAMLSDGSLLPNSLIPDIPTNIGGYIPRNFDQTYDGAIPAAKALSRSLNIPAVRLLQQYKYQRFYEFLKLCGITTLKNPAGFYGLSLVLGGCEVRMWELAGVYASFARVLNHHNNQHGRLNPEDFHAPQYFKLKPAPQQFANVPIDATSVYFTFQAMQEVMRPGEEGLWQHFNSSQKIAWKTGTSFGFRDAWAIGVTPSHVVAVWVGNADGEGRPGLIGVNTAAPVMFDIFRLLPAVSWFRKPSFQYSYLPVCPKSGYRAGLDCKEPDTLFMPPNGQKTALCPYHKIVQLDPSGRFQVNADCEIASKIVQTNWFVLPPAMEFYFRQRNHNYKPLPAFKEGCLAEMNSRSMELIYPALNTKIYVPVEITSEKGRAVFTATHRDHNMKIFWSLDNEFLQETRFPHQVAVNPPLGKHTLTITDQNGQSIAREVEIIGK